MSLTQDLKAIITLLIQIFVIFPYSALTIPRPSPRTATKPTRDTSDSEDSSVTMVSDRVHELCTSKQSVSALLAQDPTIAPGDAWKTLYGNLPSEAGSAGTEREDSTPDDLKRVAECGNWGPTQPSELFLKIYGAALGPLEKNVASAMVSPSLMGSCGVVPLTILSVVPDIMRHMSNLIVRAEKEVILATNYWQNSVASTFITNAMKELSARAGKRGERIVMKIIYDRGSMKQVLQPHYLVSEKEYLGDAVNIPKPEEIPNIDLQVMNYHQPMLGTFHCKYMIVDRRYAVLQSNNIQDNDNMEMMTHLEGPIVDSLYDMSLISWDKKLEPPLPSYNSPAAQGGLGSFGEESHHEMSQPQSAGQGSGPDVAGDIHQPGVPSQYVPEDVVTGPTATESTKRPVENQPAESDSQILESEQLDAGSEAAYKPSAARDVLEHAVDTGQLSPNPRDASDAPSSSPHQLPLRTDAVTTAFLHSSHPSLPPPQILHPSPSPLPPHTTTSPHYDASLADEVARAQSSVSPSAQRTRLQATTAHLNHTKNPTFGAGAGAAIPAGDEFTPYIAHAARAAVPMALVNRAPYGPPTDGDVYVPQNEAWLAGLRHARASVFIQSPTLNAGPVLEGILAACERGVDVFLFICLGYNDTGELLPMQGGTNEMVSNMLHTSLSAQGLRHLHYHYYVGADQTRPLPAQLKKRSCHVKLMIVDGEVGIQGNGNQDTQSWYHSQEINVLLQSREVCGDWIEGLRRCQRTGMYGKADEGGVWRDGEGEEIEGTIGIDPGRFSWFKGIAGAVRRVRGAGDF